jgi:site-specific DNA-methyltransferase (adenine-specific)
VAIGNALYFGDNLQVLRQSITDASIDLVYLDPPFNSNASYNVLFKTPKGHKSDAQVEAFEDTWHWGPQAEAEFDEVMQQPNTDVAEVLRALRSVLGQNDMMAYLTMMAVRLLELHRVLKPTGSLYLHCDPTASHYLKIVLDQVFGADQFRNEIVWRRTGSHNKSRRYGPIHDVLLFYSRSNEYFFKPVYRPYLKGHVDSYFRQTDDTGRYWTNSLTGAGTRNGESGAEWRGYNPTKVQRHWAVPGKIVDELGLDPELKTLAKLDAIAEAGFVVFPSPDSDAMPTYRQYLEQSPGIPLQDIWAYQPHTRGVLWGSEEAIDEDVRWLSAQGDSERLGYKTQKPLGLLKRIVMASSKPGDMVLDPFCGCGTAVHAAQTLDRPWIGIDVTHLAITLIEKRLRDAFPGIAFEVHGTPKDVGGAGDLAKRDPYEFQWWACSLVNAQPYKGKKKGADSGIDGLIFFQDDTSLPKKIVVSVKSGDNISVAMVRDLAHVINREKADIGLFVTLTPPSKPMIAEAAGMGFYVSPLSGAKYPRLQILTIAGLLAGTEAARYPHIDAGTKLTFKKAPVEDKEQKKLKF